MATVNIANKTWSTSSETSTIDITTSSTYVEFNMGSHHTGEQCCAKACVAFNVDGCDSITLKYSKHSLSGITGLWYGVFDNMTAIYGSDGNPTSASLSGSVTNSLSTSGGTKTFDVSAKTGTKYVGFLFYGNTNNFDYGNPYATVTITSINATLSEYTITYNANGGSNAPSSQTKIHGNTLTLTTSKPTPPASTTSNSSSTFVITGDANGGYFNSTSATTTSITATKTTPKTTTYTFSKWNTAKDGSGTSYSSGGSYTTNASDTLYAIYTSSTINGTATYSNNVISTLAEPIKDKSTVATYTVTFNANGGSCSTTSLSSSKIRTYVFNGWGSNSTADTTLANTTTYTAATTVYAVWDNSDTTAIITLPTPIRNGYAFLGWATSEYDTSGSIGEYTPTSDITLYAIWKCMGNVYIYDNTEEFSPYQVFIYDDSGWNQYIPYIYTESGWELYSG